MWANVLFPVASLLLFGLVGGMSSGPITGDDPAFYATLVIDVTTAGSGADGVPEPSTWAMMLLGFAGLGFVGYRRMGGAGAAVRAG